VPNGRRYYLGVDIGGTTTAVVLGDETASSLERVAFQTDHAKGPETVIGQIVQAAQRLAADTTVETIGISCGGPLDSARGIVLGPPNLPGWDEVPVVDRLQAAMGLPTFLENDANAGALAEWRYGAGRGCRNVIFITAGTGLGCGLILDGRLYSGTNDMAGEAGHIRLAPTGPQGYGKQGSLEGFCSGAGIGRLAELRIQQAHGEASILAEWTRGRAVTARHVAQAARDGDTLARSVLRHAGERLGEGLAILIDILNPELIVVGSLAVRLGELYLGPAREVVAREALSRSSRVCRIVPAQLGERIGDVAALCVAMRVGRSAGVTGPTAEHVRDGDCQRRPPES